MTRAGARAGPCRGDDRLDAAACSTARARSCAASAKPSAYFSDIGWRRHPDDRAARRLRPGADRAFRRRRSSRPRPDRHLGLPPLFRRRGFSPRPGPGRACWTRTTRSARCAWAWPGASPFRCRPRRWANLAHYRLRMTPGQDRAGSSRAGARPLPASRCRSGWAHWPRPSTGKGEILVG